MITDRERLCAVLSNMPLMRADAIVLLTGDGEARIPTAVELLRQNAAPIILVSGGVDNPPYARTADHFAAILYGHGVAPSRVCVENESQNTYDSANKICARTVVQGWTQLLLVTSPYHTPRAFLTFLQVLRELKCDDTVRLVPAPCGVLPWFRPINETVSFNRIDLLADEFAKIDRYQAHGHVASYTDGLAYLEQWEAK